MAKSASYLAATGLSIAAFWLTSMAHANSDVEGMNAIAKSHIDSNVPAPRDFDVFLKRDLTRYFSQRLRRDVSVKFQPLRIGVTQSGTAYPKFYYWVAITDSKSGGTLEEGAVRLAAIEKTSFDVTDFIAVEDMKIKPDILRSIFPAAVIDSIKDRIK